MRKNIFVLIAAATILLEGQSFAAAFGLNNSSASSIGTAHAGAGSLAQDASTIWYNPAGLTKLCGMQIVAGGDVILPVVDFDDDGSLALGIDSSSPSTLTLVPMNGNDGGGNIGQNALVGISYFSWRIDDCWAVGLGVTSPYGLVTNYSGEWKGRYRAVTSTVLTININPTIAYKINDCWSVGAGFDAMYLHSKLSNKIDFGLLGILAFQNPIFGLPQENDAFVQLKGNSWGFGGNVGVLFEPWCGTRFGISYRSEVKQNVKGKEKFDDLPINLDEVPSLAEQFQNTRFKSKVTLPQSLILSAYHELNDCFAVVADAMWTNWDVFKDLRIKYNNRAQADTVLPLEWNNTWRFALGGIYTWDCNWKFRAGICLRTRG